VIDAAGQVVAPGFIDMHSHSDLFYFGCPSAESKVRQGVTTEVVGMCSFSQAPMRADQREIVRGWAGGIGASLDLKSESFAQYLDALRAVRPSVNVAHFVGHGALRIAAMGFEARPAGADDVQAMQQRLGEAMDAGAFGFSTGLVYAPSAYSDTAELIALARAMAPRGGYYFSHIRGESSMLLDSINEAIRIGEEGGVGVQVSHVKASGRENWPKIDAALRLLEDARARGVDVAGDVYPYNAGSTKLDNMMPAWAHDGGTAKLCERLADRAMRRRIVEECLIDGERWGTVSQGGIGEYVREQRLFPLETAVHKMTGMGAARLRLRDRGLVREGYVADLAIFDPRTVKDESTFPEPHRYPTGIPYVVVNGAVVVDGG